MVPTVNTHFQKILEKISKLEESYNTIKIHLTYSFTTEKYSIVNNLGNYIINFTWNKKPNIEINWKKIMIIFTEHIINNIIIVAIHCAILIVKTLFTNHILRMEWLAGLVPVI